MDLFRKVLSCILIQLQQNLNLLVLMVTMALEILMILFYLIFYKREISIAVIYVGCVVFKFFKLNNGELNRDFIEKCVLFKKYSNEKYVNNFLNVNRKI